MKTHFALLEALTQKSAELPHLILLGPGPRTLTPGGVCPIPVAVVREHFPGDLVVRFENLPPGVSLVDRHSAIPAELNEEDFTLRADPSTPPVSRHPVAISLESRDGNCVSETFELTIVPSKKD